MARKPNPVRQWLRTQLAGLRPGDAMTVDATGHLDTDAEVFRKAVDHECHALFGPGTYTTRNLGAVRAHIARRAT